MFETWLIADAARIGKSLSRSIQLHWSWRYSDQLGATRRQNAPELLPDYEASAASIL
jgi:hypothetical protein